MILRRLAAHAATLPKDAVVPRIGLADLAYPRSQAELKAMGGFAAMVLTVICRDGAELPVAKVEMRLKDDHIELAPVATRLMEMSLGAASPAYGRSRLDGVYLVPIFMTRRESTVVALLGSGARPLTVLEFPSAPDEDHLPSGLDFNWPPFQPQTSAIHKLIDDELPVLSGIKFIGEDGSPARNARP